MTKLTRSDLVKRAERLMCSGKTLAIALDCRDADSPKERTPDSIPYSAEGETSKPHVETKSLALSL